ncbi:uncharacterized protein LOC116306607 isoform X2 [Actinia tenebrosa]|uniref:Uncharacterized protein LOC116306607 isoform X2 n=1 Tax=Actinia tenebrosa TaxID=6105 RepID=A0A6P8IZE1_ACTTE|nr:uncharacterized protein LOC116306607 isoform X2 [Actinia tenebrosa]
MALLLLSTLSRREPLLASFVKRFQSPRIITKSRRLGCVGFVKEKSYQASQVSENDLFSHIHPSKLASKEKYSLAGVRYLAGSNDKGFPKFLGVPRKDLPHALQVEHADKFSISEWAQNCRHLLDNELSKYGAILFRGLPLSKGEQFSVFTNAIGYSPMGYEGGAVDRPVFDKKAFTFVSTSENKDLNIEPHSDMAYSAVYPNKIIFYCDMAPAPGCRGLTPISSNIEILQKLDTKVVQKFEEKQVRYMRTLPSGEGYLPWQVTFGTDNRKVEKYLETNGFYYEWNKDDDSLFYWLTLPPTKYHPITGEKVWFNQIESHHSSYFKSSPMMKGMHFESDTQCPLHTSYGDGKEIEPEVIQHIRKISWECTVGFPWRNGDVLVLDNVKCRHSRLSFTGERRILVFMSPE